MMKSPCTLMPTFLQFFMNSRAISVVAPFLMFFRICASPDSNPTIKSRAPPSAIAFSSSYLLWHRAVQDHWNFSGLNFWLSSITRSRRMLNVSSSKKISFICGKYSSVFFTSCTTLSTLRVRHACPEIVCGHMRTYNCDLQSVIFLFNFPNELDVAVESVRRRIKNQKIIVRANLNRLLPVNLVGGSVQQPAARNHSRRVRQPHRIPIRLNLSR